MNIQCFSLNEQGGRKNVEDAILPVSYTGSELPVFVLCDGVGGNSFGEVASEYAVKHFYKIFCDGYQKVPLHLDKLINEALTGFQNDLENFVNANPGAYNSSTTLTVFILIEQSAYLIWSGDSRIYHIRNGKILYRTKDHSLVAQLVASGEITEAEASTHSKKNVITRCLNSGTKPADIETAKISDVQPGDWFMSCTDGLLENFTEDKFSELFKTYDKHKNYAAEIDTICKGKTGDNYSMQLVHINGGSNGKSSSLITWIVLPILLICSSWFGYNYYKKNVANKNIEYNKINTTGSQPKMNSADVLPTIIEVKKPVDSVSEVVQKDTMKVMRLKK